MNKLTHAQNRVKQKGRREALTTHTEARILAVKLQDSNIVDKETGEVVFPSAEWESSYRAARALIDNMRTSGETYLAMDGGTASSLVGQTLGAHTITRIGIYFVHAHNRVLGPHLALKHGIRLIHVWEREHE